jgi:hypothetical protein
VPGRHTGRLRRFLIELIEIVFAFENFKIREFNFKKDENNEKLKCYLHCEVEFEGAEEVSDSEFFTEDHGIDAIINIQSDSKALLRIMDDDDKEVYRQELLLQKEKNVLHVLTKE